ncbi:MAG: hypothetical protein QM762_19760 [Chryseolinea sp.]
MKTSQNNIELIERYLGGQLLPEEILAFEQRLQTDLTLSTDVRAQREVHQLARRYHLLKLRHHAKNFHHRLHNDPSRRSLRQAIEALFN